MIFLPLLQSARKAFTDRFYFFLKGFYIRVMKKKLLSVVLFSFALASCHVGRFFIWNFADISDYKKFPHQPVNKGTNPYQFITVGENKSLKLPTDVTRKKKHYAFDNALAASGTAAFLIIRNDSLLYEKYFNNFHQESIVPSFSAAKSFVSALVGIAVDEGKIKNVQDPITNYLTELDKNKFGAITIEQVLDMQSGIRFNENYMNPFADVGKYYYGRNLRKYITKLKIKEPPGRHFDYLSVNTQLLGMIVERATGQPLNEYLQEKIWKPLGMEFDASWSVDSRKHKEVKAFCCLNARARDFARFGRLFLNNGNWDGRQIISQQWVNASTTFDKAKNGFKYSYQWWHNVNYAIRSDTVKVTGLFEDLKVRQQMVRCLM